jgi:hypothetical protein
MAATGRYSFTSWAAEPAPGDEQAQYGERERSSGRAALSPLDVNRGGKEDDRREARRITVPSSGRTSCRHAEVGRDQRA